MNRQFNKGIMPYKCQILPFAHSRTLGPKYETGRLAFTYFLRTSPTTKYFA